MCVKQTILHAFSAQERISNLGDREGDDNSNRIYLSAWEVRATYPSFYLNVGVSFN
jgi:hypothetical protein